MNEKEEETAEVTFSGKVDGHLLRCPRFGFGRWMWVLAASEILSGICSVSIDRDGVYHAHATAGPFLVSAFFIPGRLMAMVGVSILFCSG
jgi:hypothetical protein